jgi:hypothetical protein
MKFLPIPLAILLLAPAVTAAEPVDYVRDIKPLFKERCYACHGALKQKAKLRLDTATSMLKAGVVEPGKLDSELIARVTSADDDTRMPPEGKPLTAEQVAKLKAWIAAGAKAPADEPPETDPRQHWAFQRPKRPQMPTDKHQFPNSIDALLAAEWEKHGLTPAGPADRATLLRRVYLDLIGLPPTRKELHAFLTDDSPDAYEKVVDRLLASPQYGERWARHWMDVWRYSDWYGRRSTPDVLNSYGQIWRWRDWIVRSLNEDRGYDRMIVEMLAADEVCPEDDSRVVATGFVVRNFFRWNYNNWMRDNVEHTAKAFLGLTLNCCHCHDHKYDPITQQEYFQFRAFFEPIEIRHDRWPGEPDPGQYPKYSYGASYKPITSGMVRVVDEKLDAKTQFYTRGDERNVEKDREPVPPGVPAFLGGGKFEVKPVALPPTAWYPGLKPFVRAEERAKRVQSVKSAEAALARAKAAARPTPTAVGALGGVTSGVHVIRINAVRVAEARLTSARSDLASLDARIAADDVIHLGKPGDAKAVKAAAAVAEWQYRYDSAVAALMQADAVGKPTGPTRKALNTAWKEAARPILDYSPLTPTYPKTSTGRRTALANWIADRDNPLTARVAVNHILGWHFGRPLVETTNNLGRSGAKPSHPELLDWLAVEFMEKGWRQKPLHRLIVTSRAYRMSSRSPSSNDPDNVWLARFPTLRIEAEVVRDSLLSVAGVLDRTAGGPEIPQDQGLKSNRRSLYFSHHGETRMEFLDLFDAANPCDAYIRTATVLPQQALALANSELTLRLSRTLATKLTGTDTEFVRAAFEQVLSRPPRDAELTAALDFLKRQAALFEVNKAELKPAKDGPSADPKQRVRENLVHALFNHTDFVTVR